MPLLVVSGCPTDASITSDHYPAGFTYRFRMDLKPESRLYFRTEFTSGGNKSYGAPVALSGISSRISAGESRVSSRIAGGISSRFSEGFSSGLSPNHIRICSRVPVALTGISSRYSAGESRVSSRIAGGISSRISEGFSSGLSPNHIRIYSRVSGRSNRDSRTHFSRAKQ